MIGASSIGAGGRGLGVLLTFIPLFLVNGLNYAGDDVLFGFYCAWTYAIGALWVAAIGAAIDRGGFTMAWIITAITYLGAAGCIFLSRDDNRETASAR